MEETRLTGSVFYNYVICPRKAWLMQYQINPDTEHDLLSLGRLNSQEHYERAEKEAVMPGIRVDIVHRERDQLVLGEVKKSSSGLEASTLQLAYYLHRLEDEGVEARGEVLVPKERKKVPVRLDVETRERLSRSKVEIEDLLRKPSPPPANWIKFCPNCAYAEFCWS